MMKNIIKISAILMFLVVCSMQGNAQFTAKSKIISAGVSAGLYGKYHKELLTYDRTSTPPVYLQLEKGMKEGSVFAEYSKYLTTGVFFGFNSQKLTANRLTVDHVAYEQWINYTFIDGGLLLSGHYTELLGEMDINLDPNVIDLYVSVKAGIAMMYSKANFDSDTEAIEIAANIYEYKDNQSYIYAAPIVGGRYYFTKNLAVQLELGYFNFGKISAGLSYKM